MDWLKWCNLRTAFAYELLLCAEMRGIYKLWKKIRKYCLHRPWRA